MKPYKQGNNYTIYNGNSLDILDTLPENSIDSVVTDPPYEIGFMNKGWDSTGVVFSKDTWAKVLRVLKPGGYVLAFNHSRTFHRMAVAIEDAGFEIRDTIMWLYGSGFPKSHNISKAIDSRLGAERQKIRIDSSEVRNPKAIGGGTDGMEGGTRPWIEKALEIGYHEKDSNESVTEEAKQWDGWGTALKPAHEPIIMARKPFNTSVADNVLTHGVGGINIDECRVGTETITYENGCGGGKNDINRMMGGNIENDQNFRNDKWEQTGRFPANVIHDGSDEVTAGFPNTKSNGSDYDFTPSNNDNVTNILTNIKSGKHFDDEGSAARFFYTAKASKKDRDEGLDGFENKNNLKWNGNTGIGRYYPDGTERPQKNTIQRNIHPTVKPTDLMQYLIRLVSPKGSTILDLFMGSGSTGKAAMIENTEREANYHFIGIDLSQEYCDIAEARIEYGINYREIEEMNDRTSVVLDEQGNTKEAVQSSIFDLL